MKRLWDYILRLLVGGEDDILDFGGCDCGAVISYILPGKRLDRTRRK